MTVHELKTWPEYFIAVTRGVKQFEVRRNDRGFEVGDQLLLREWVPGPKLLAASAERGGGRYTGAETRVTVTYILRGFEGLTPGFVVLGIEPFPAFP